MKSLKCMINYEPRTEKVYETRKQQTLGLRVYGLKS
jgi:hypothetical protein